MPPVKPANTKRPTTRRRTDLWVLLALTIVVVVGVTAANTGSEREERPLVYVSGLDDHLLPAADEVAVHEAVGGAVTGHVPADTLVWVHDEQGEWLDVATAEGTTLRGWIADFYLRGELHVVDPSAPGCPVPTAHHPQKAVHHQLDASTRVEMTDLYEGSSGLWVEVRDLRTENTSWVRRDTLSERPGPNPDASSPGTECSEVLPEPAVPHNH